MTHHRRAVGFDLDLTLIDSRPQILASFAALSATTGVAIDPAGVTSRLGVKLEEELTHWFAPEQRVGAAEIYRDHYSRLATETSALPGAREVLEELRLRSVASIVVTAKHERSVRTCLDAAGLFPDEVYCFLHGLEKATVLAERQVACYVGDTPADLDAARAAGVPGIGVATGSFRAAALADAGATVVLSDLFALIGLLDELVGPAEGAC